LTTADGERLVFSVIANHFTVPTRVVDAAVDAALERLANLTRQAK
jgi:D-alanyl-D-alanine carboxypeptidase